MKIFSGKYRGRKLFSPKEGVRPSSGRLREALFNILGPSIEGMRVLELFAGTGAVGIEALSRGAESVVFVEKAPELLRKNLNLVGEEQRVIAGDVFGVLGTIGRSFDLIFADPPYGEGMGDRLVEAIDGSDLLAEGGSLFVEERAIGDVACEHLVFDRERKYGKSNLYCWERTTA